MLTFSRRQAWCVMPFRWNRRGVCVVPWGRTRAWVLHTRGAPGLLRLAGAGGHLLSSVGSARGAVEELGWGGNHSSFGGVGSIPRGEHPWGASMGRNSTGGSTHAGNTNGEEHPREERHWGEHPWEQQWGEHLCMGGHPWGRSTCGGVLVGRAP